MIRDELYHRMKEELPAEEFERRFKTEFDDMEYQDYFEIIDDDPEDSKLTEYLLDQILEQQILVNQRLGIISEIMIASLVCGFIAALILILA